MGEITLIEKRNRYWELNELSERLFLFDDVSSINRLLIDYYLEDLPMGTELRTFKTWKANGYRIKKGSKGYMIWGKARKRGDLSVLATAEMPEREKYYPLIYLFSSLQVELVSG